MSKQPRTRAIAIICDDPTYAQLLGQLLESEGFQPQVYAEGAAAHAQLRAQPPLAALLTFSDDLPDALWSTLQILRLDPTTSQLPLVVAYGHHHLIQQQASRLQERGCLLLERPFAMADLLAVISEAVSTPTPAEPAPKAAATTSEPLISEDRPGGRRYYEAIDAVKRGDRDAAYWLMRQAIVEDPTYVPAWLRMASLVDNPGQQRECFERALALDPACGPAREGLEMLNLREMLNKQAVVVAQPVPNRRSATRKLGAYLVEQGFITPMQLEKALLEQRTSQNRRGDHVALGDIFLQHGWITPQALAMALVMQQKDKLADGTSGPEHLGEYLVKHRILTADQLAAVLAQQAGLRQAGQRILLGELLIRGGYVSSEALEEVLARQREDFFERFWT